MSTQFIFGNKVVKIPGAYSQIESGIKNPTLDLAFGNALIIDTGSGANWGGGSGINGTLESGKNSLYTFDNVRDFQQFVGGGLHWYLGGPMFFPGGNATGGISSLTLARAATTVPAEIDYTFVGGGANGGTVEIQVKAEGIVGNGILGDETSAQSVVTVTNAGADTDSIEILYSGTRVAYYVNNGGETIAQMVAGLVASAKSINLVQVVASNATSLTITALVGQGSAANSITPTVTVTGTAAGNATQYSGGVDGTKVTRGYSAIMKAGIIDTAKFIIDFYRGTFRGTDEAVNLGINDVYESLPEADTTPQLLVSSIEFDNVAELVTWMTDDATFNTYFFMKTGLPAGTGVVDAADLATYSGNNLAAGGTETYSSTDIDDVLAAISDLFYDFILLDNWGDNGQSANNTKIQGWVATTAKVKPDLYVGGGADANKWSQASGSILTAEFYNSENVTVVHGGVKIPDNTKATGYRSYDSIVTAAYVLGREAGIEPQVPLAFKSIGIGGVLHNLVDTEIGQGLDAGVLMIRRSGTTFDIVKGINSLQLNNFLVNPDGSTSSKQIRRIARQLNKELVTNATTQLLKNPDGTNRNTLSIEDIESWLQGYLKNKVATDTDDDLILSFGNITVNVVNDAYEVTYEIVPNFEVNFVFFTGFLLDPTA
jgi:hypothetical protein